MNTSVLQRVDLTTWIALGCVAGGWFGLSTFVTSLGPLRQVAYFYDIPAAMHDPSRLVSGIAATRSFGTFMFAIICLAAIAAPVLPRIGFRKLPRLLAATPFLLMALCVIVLYVKASTAHIEASDSMGRIGGYLASWANSAMQWTGDVVSRHIAIGIGGYVSFIASLLLAVRGILDPRPSVAEAAPASEPVYPPPPPVSAASPKDLAS